MKTIPSIPLFVAALIMTGIWAGSGSTASAMSIGNVNMHSEIPPVVLIVNKDQFEGNWKQFKGDLKKQWGKLTDDDLLVIEGNYDKFEGRVQERYGDKREEVKRWTDEWFKQHHPIKSEKTNK
ncbi:MAG: CsbD family protein [Nitrospira sp. BO4]|nr:CsbD family protein [Nitrospira sp. BO4]